MLQKTRILYIGDSPADAEPALRELGLQGLENDCVVLSDPGEIAEALKKKDFDILLSGPALKKIAVKELLEKRNQLAPELPFIAITGTQPEEQAAELLSLGATDCVPSDRLSGLPGVLNRSLAGLERETRYRQAQKMEAVGRLAGGIAHDFNNILGAIEGYATLGLRRLDEADPLWADLGDIRKAVARASALTKQLLVFSRKHALKKEPACPEAVIEKMHGVFARLAGGNIQVRLEVAPGLPKIMADQGQLEQLLLNLFVNARDAMPSGGAVTVKAGLARLEPRKVLSPNPVAAGADFVKISVADTGTGMPRSVVEHLFEPFFTTKEKGKGTGLGLSVAYGIASQHNGWLEVATEEGKGSEFSLFLPAGPSVPAERPPEPPAALSTAPFRRCPGSRVLVVEDDADLRNILQKALTAAGLTTATAAGAAEALKIFRAAGGGFDLVFSDVLLQDGNATEIVDVMLGINPRTRFILASGYEQPGPVLDFIRGRGYKFFLKPYAIEAVIEAVCDCLKV